MAVDMSRLTKARQLWPKQTASLPASVQAFYTAWEQCREADQDAALETIPGFTRSPGRYSAKQKCRDLTLLRTPSPSSAGPVPHLSEDDVAVFFGGVVTPYRLGGDSDNDSVRSTPSSDERLNVLESSLSKCLDTIGRQNDQLATQAATLDRLFKAQADPEEIQTSTYEVADSVLSKLGLTAMGKMSWLDVKPLPKSERKRILREHGGTYKTFPPDLDMLASTKALKLVQDAKVTLPNFATQEVAKFMSRNTGTMKMCGTVLSRVRELKSDLTAPPEEDGEDEDDEVLPPRFPSSVPTDVLLEFFTVLELAAEGSLDLAIDCQTLMRMSVSRRIESALGVAHLQQDPTKRPKEDFISPKTLTLIEDAAKMREDLTWAMEARKVATSENSSLFGGRPRKSPGGGQRNPSAHGRGQGRGTGNHTSGKGKGKPKKVKWDSDKGESHTTTDE
jgi:hypothetical protein